MEKGEEHQQKEQYEDENNMNSERSERMKEIDLEEANKHEMLIDIEPIRMFNYEKTNEETGKNTNDDKMDNTDAEREI